MNSNKFFEGDKVQVIIKTSEDMTVRKCRGSFVWKCGGAKFYPSDAPYAYRDPSF